MSIGCGGVPIGRETTRALEYLKGSLAEAEDEEREGFWEREWEVREREFDGEKKRENRERKWRKRGMIMGS